MCRLTTKWRPIEMWHFAMQNSAARNINAFCLIRKTINERVTSEIRCRPIRACLCKNEKKNGKKENIFHSLPLVLSRACAFTRGYGYSRTRDIVYKMQMWRTKQNLFSINSFCRDLSSAGDFVLIQHSFSDVLPLLVLPFSFSSRTFDFSRFYYHV